MSQSIHKEKFNLLGISTKISQKPHRKILKQILGELKCLCIDFFVPEQVTLPLIFDREEILVNGKKYTWGPSIDPFKLFCSIH